MSRQYTPGPWAVVERSDAKMISSWNIRIGAVEIGFFPYVYKFADVEKTCGGYVKNAEMHANARLIATAPDLLEAIEALTHSIDREDILHDDQRSAFDQAIAIIAKATEVS